MHRPIAALAAAAAALATAAVASPLPPAPPSGSALQKGECLLTHEMGRHSVVDEKTLLVSGFGRSKGTYRLTMRSGCLRGAVSSDPISVRQTGKSAICKPQDVDLMVRGGVCIVESIDKLSPDQLAALPRRLKP